MRVWVGFFFRRLLCISANDEHSNQSINKEAYLTGDKRLCQTVGNQEQLTTIHTLTKPLPDVPHLDAIIGKTFDIIIIIITTILAYKPVSDTQPRSLLRVRLFDVKTAADKRTRSLPVSRALPASFASPGDSSRIIKTHKDGIGNAGETTAGEVAAAYLLLSLRKKKPTHTHKQEDSRWTSPAASSLSPSAFHSRGINTREKVAHPLWSGKGKILE